MASTTIRVSADTYAAVRRLAGDDDRTIGQVVAEAVDRYDREQALAALNAAYACIEANPHASAAWQAELNSLEGTLLDGLADDPWGA